ncbi:uncharacterized protein LOC122320598 [Drosophila ficusphila]|uniref:uncharacterized protein LOC122320598 n=1 Tax=Drosophila ficusphila TaxID=30025 RepID=UPI001C891C67|nr:uncharacterized protein LOC122320598 [Drosophila ficusphila]
MVNLKTKVQRYHPTRRNKTVKKMNDQDRKKELQARKKALKKLVFTEPVEVPPPPPPNNANDVNVCLGANNCQCIRCRCTEDMEDGPEMEELAYNYLFQRNRNNEKEDTHVNHNCCG